MTGWFNTILFTADEQLAVHLSSGQIVTGQLFDISLSGTPYLPHKDTITIKTGQGGFLTIGVAHIIAVEQRAMAAETPQEYVPPPIPTALPPAQPKPQAAAPAKPIATQPAQAKPLNGGPAPRPPQPPQRPAVAPTI